MNVTIIKGNVCEPIGDGKKIIVHCCNDIGVMGSGVAGALRKKWPTVGEDYEDWHNDWIKKPFVLGQIQFVKVEEDIVVCNLIGQRGIGGETIDGEFVPPVKYESLREGFLRVRGSIKKAPNSVSLHLPMLGSALAGGDWVSIYELIRDVFDELDIECTIYAFDDVNLKLAQSTHQEYEERESYLLEIERGDIIG